MSGRTLSEQRSFSLERYTLILAGGLISLQIIDAVLTAIGVGRFGIDSEGNPMLRALMLEIGAIPALALVKCFAIACILLLCCLLPRVRWIPHALLATCGVYLFVAVVPWSYYLFLMPWLETTSLFSY